MVEEISDGELKIENCKCCVYVPLAIFNF